MAQLIKTLPTGAIIWNGFDIIGVVGDDEFVAKFGNDKAIPAAGSNSRDYDIVVTEANKKRH